MTRLVAAASLLAAALGAHAAPHQHGVVALDVAVDGAALTLELRAPLDSLVGFERAPRNEAERAAAADALQRLGDPVRLFAPDAAAQCTPTAPQVKAGVLAPGAQPAAGEHADLQATYRYTCAQPSRLQVIGLPVFHTFRRIERIDARTVGPQGQHQTTLRRRNALLKLAP